VGIGRHRKGFKNHSTAGEKDKGSTKNTSKKTTEGAKGEEKKDQGVKKWCEKSRGKGASLKCCNGEGHGKKNSRERCAAFRAKG